MKSIRSVVAFFVVSLSLPLLAAGPSQAEIDELTERAIALRSGACDEPTNLRCVEMHEELARIRGTQAAMQAIIVEGAVDPVVYELKRQELETLSKQAEENCKSSKYFSECSANLIDMEGANAFLGTLDKFKSTEDLQPEIAATQAAVRAPASVSPLTGQAIGLCDPKTYGDLCKNALEHVETTQENCNEDSAGEQCKDVKTDLDQVATDLASSAAAAAANP